MTKVNKLRLKEIAKQELRAIHDAGADKIRILMDTSESSRRTENGEEITIYSRSSWEDQKNPQYKDRFVRVMVSVNDGSFWRQFVPITADNIYDLQTGTWMKSE